jgi:hypothetical protein
MPALGNALDFSKYEARNIRAHQLGAAPSSPVTGQMYYNTADNTLYWFNGTIWVSASGGAPSGAAGGDLSGTYPNPQIAPGVIVDADVSASAAIAKSKLAALAIVNADVAAGAAIAYAKLALTGAILNGDLAGGIALSKLATDPLARANHTGTQLAATISDFTTARDLQRLDQHVAPTAAVTLNSQKITNLADPTAATDGANKQYVDSLAQGLSAKEPVWAASTGNVVIATDGSPNGFNIDGSTFNTVSSGTRNRVLLKNQTTASENGIYVVSGAAGGPQTMARAADMDASVEFPSAYTWVESGTTNADTGWVCTNDPLPIASPIPASTWVQFTGAGQVTAGAGLTKTGNSLDVGAAAGITVAADTVGVATGGVTNAMLAGSIDATTKLTGAVPVANGGTSQTTAKAARETGLAAAGYYSSATHGAGATITITQATHGLRASRGLIVQAQDEATGAVELPDIVVAANGDVTVTYGASVSANSKRVTVTG